MIRKGVSLVLALGVLLTHLAAAPHLQGPDGRAGRPGDARPHVHLGPLGLAGAPETEQTDHDADAWYLSDPGLNTSASELPSAAPPPAVLASATLARPLPGQAEFVPAAAVRPPACPLFVRHRALLL